MITVSLTRVSPACDVALGQVLRCSFPPIRQAHRKYGVTLVHALSALTPLTSVLCQAHQSEVVVVALWTVARMQDDSVHTVFVLVFLGNEGVIIADADFVGACSVTVPERKKGKEEKETDLRAHWEKTLHTRYAALY